MNSVNHEDSDTRENNYNTCKQTSKDVEDHERSEAGQIDVLHCMKTKQSNGNEDKATIDFLTSQRMSGVKGEGTQDDEEYYKTRTKNYM